MVVSLSLCLVHPLFLEPDRWAAVMLALPAAVAGVVAATLRAPTRWASFVLDLLHFLVVLATATFVVRYGVGFVPLGALIMIAYAAVQLETAHLAVMFLLDVVVFVGAGAWAGTFGGAEGLMLAAALALGALMHLANRRFTEGSEALRAKAEESAAALEQALADARHQIRERERAEAEREAAETERAQLSERLMEAHRLEALGTLAGGFAHDMNNLLGGVLGLATLLREQTAGDAQHDVDEIIAATKRGSELTQSLLTLGRRRQARRDPTNLEPMVSRVASLLTRTLPKRIHVALSLKGELALLGDAAQLEQALLNLCLNGVDAMPEGGTLTLSATAEELAPPRAAALDVAPGPYVALAVRDEGVGLAPEVARRMFEPFFTTKEPGRGTGLGLAMVYGTVQAHHGGIDVVSAPGSGTTITLYLPAGGEVSERREAGPASGEHAARGRILVIDDDPLLRATTRRMLERAGFQVTLADGGLRGLEAYGAEPGFVVLLDLAMPGMDGPETFQRLRALDPAVRVVLTSGYAFQKDVQACIDAGACGFLEKPYEPGALIEALVCACDGTRAAQRAS